MPGTAPPTMIVLPMIRSPLRPCTPLAPGSAGMPPAAGVPKSVNAA